ncbi:MAG TPA: CHRD domain-containing protein [Planctomycetaceae bacterium]|nr:CHRD domain-containing protein [Planctomycetaceae bacterium]
MCAGLAVFLSVANTQAADFTASLTGGAEVPPVATNATGSASFTFLSVLDTELLVTVRTNTRLSSRVTGAHIHTGAVGVAGPIVLDFSNGSIVNTAILGININSAAHLSGSLAGQTLSDLRELMTTGDTYINVHTSTNPSGEIRGQIELAD